MLTLLYVVAVQLSQSLFESLYKLLFLRLVYQQIVGSNARLPCIQGFAPSYSARSHCNVGFFVHNAGTFSAKFEHYGREVFGGGLHHRFAECGASRKKDNIESLVKKHCVHIAIALHYGDVFFVESFFYHLGQHCRYVWHIRRRLQNSGTACRDGAYKRIQQQLYGIVPRSDYQCIAEWFGYDVTARREHFERSGIAFAFHPRF